MFTAFKIIILIITYKNIEFRRLTNKMSSSRNKKDDDFGFDEDEAMPGSASIIEVEEESPKATQITKRQQASGENSAGPALATSSDPHYFDIK